ELEHRAKLREGCIRNIITGKSQNPTIRTILAICKVFDCSIEEMIGEDLPNESTNTQSLTQEWDSNLGLDCIKTLNQILYELDIHLSVQRGLCYFNEIYKFNVINNNQVCDKKFAKWYVENH